MSDVKTERVTALRRLPGVLVIAVLCVAALVMLSYAEDTAVPVSLVPDLQPLSTPVPGDSFLRGYADGKLTLCKNDPANSSFTVTLTDASGAPVVLPVAENFSDQTYFAAELGASYMTLKVSPGAGVLIKPIPGTSSFNVIFETASVRSETLYTFSVSVGRSLSGLYKTAGETFTLAVNVLDSDLIIDMTKPDDLYVDIFTERLLGAVIDPAKNYSISLNGGATWSKMGAPLNFGSAEVPVYGFNLTRYIGKRELTPCFAVTPRKGSPEERFSVIPKGYYDGVTVNANIVNIIKPRPVLPKDIKLSYGGTPTQPVWYINGLPDGAAAEFSPRAKEASAYQPYSLYPAEGVPYGFFSVSDGAVISVSEPKDAMYGNIYSTEYPKLKAIKYSIRLRAEITAEGLQPGSVAKTLMPLKQATAPKLLYNYRKEILKVKAGYAFFTSGVQISSPEIPATSDPASFVASNAYVLDSDRDEQTIRYGLGVSSLIDAADDPSAGLYVFASADDRRPPSAIAKATTLKRSAPPEISDFTTVNGKLKYDTRTFEFYNQTYGSWGSAPRALDGTTVIVRRKSGNGMAASLIRRFNVTISGTDEKGKPIYQLSSL